MDNVQKPIILLERNFVFYYSEEFHEQNSHNYFLKKNLVW
jgi:hypothetical protein